jgi:hypothetical protein
MPKRPASRGDRLVHGGRTHTGLDAGARDYACIQHLAGIAWREAKVPVVIAHAGCFGCALDEIEREVLPRLDAMLAANDNLSVDLSAPEHDVMALVLARVGIDRVLFGSDALYEPVKQSAGGNAGDRRRRRTSPESCSGGAGDAVHGAGLQSSAFRGRRVSGSIGSRPTP